MSLTARLLVVLSITKQQYFRTLSLIVRESGWPLEVALVGPRIAARLKLDTGGAADFSGAAVDAARAKMRIKAPTLEIDYQLERKPPKVDVATTPQFWVCLNTTGTAAVACSPSSFFPSFCSWTGAPCSRPT